MITITLKKDTKIVAFEVEDTITKRHLNKSISLAWGALLSAPYSITTDDDDEDEDDDDEARLFECQLCGDMTRDIGTCFMCKETAL